MSFSSKNTEDNETFVYEYGKASYYGHPFIGRKTASGEIFTEHLYTCAHKSLPFGTKLKITNLINGHSIIVKVNDRGPFVRSRVVDLSLRGARELGLMQSGVANVSIEIVNPKFSTVGNARNMEKIFVDDTYAYIDRNDVKKMDDLFLYLQETSQLSETNSISQPETKEKETILVKNELEIENK
jgi:rare lipoprotein A